MDVNSQDGGRDSSPAPRGSAEGSMFGAFLFGSKRKDEQQAEMADQSVAGPFASRPEPAESGGETGDPAETLVLVANSNHSLGSEAPDEGLPEATLGRVTSPEAGSVRHDAPDGVDRDRRTEGERLAGLGEDLERRSRKSATMSRLIEQHRRHLRSAEKDRAEAYERLARIMPVVQETAASLREAMNSRRFEPDPARMKSMFDLNEKALNELGSLTTALSADFLWLKSAWDQYTRSLEDADTLR